jgi:hypothetical protein
MAAFIIDSEGFSGVPRTVVAEISADVFPHEQFLS